MKGKTVFETGFIRVQLLRHKYSLHATAKLCDGERERKKKKERKKPWVKINKRGRKQNNEHIRERRKIFKERQTRRRPRATLTDKATKEKIESLFDIQENWGKEFPSSGL